MQEYRSFIEKTENLIARCQESERITLGEIQTIFGYTSHFILILFLSIPFLQPVPIPGLSTILGLGIIFSSLCIVFSRKIYIPKSLQAHVFATKKIVRTTTFLLKLFSQTEKWSHPRGRFMGKHSFLRKVNGTVLLLSGLLLALPLPLPLSNTLPAYTIAFLCIGSLKEDGIFIGIGWVLFGVSVTYITALIDYSLHLLGSFETIHIPLLH